MHALKAETEHHEHLEGGAIGSVTGVSGAGVTTLVHPLTDGDGPGSVWQLTRLASFGNGNSAWCSAGHSSVGNWQCLAPWSARGSRCSSTSRAPLSLHRPAELHHLRAGRARAGHPVSAARQQLELADGRVELQLVEPAEPSQSEEPEEPRC